MLNESEPVELQATDETSSSLNQKSEGQISKTINADTDIPLEENEEIGQKKQPRAKQKSSGKRRRKPAQDRVTAWFAACGRCSFFLAGFTLVCGEEALETAVEQRGTRWLTLPWSWEIVDLVHKSFGSRFDNDCYHFEGCCPECRRNFVYQAVNEAGETATIRIELKPRTR